MLQKILLPSESQLRLDSLQVEEERIIFAVSSTRPQAECPCCGTPSERIHSHYQRSPADLPFVGVEVRFAMNVRRFFCLNQDCERTIFTERIPSLLAPYARRTNRLQGQQLQAAFALGGEGGARLLTLLGMPTSHDTLLRMIRSALEDEVATPKVLGVDDWAKKKGHSYGTILVDLENRQVVDLLPDREATSLERWLKAHPGVEIISRDRGNYYIKGATEGAPDAIQVADRWHLLKNLRDNLQEWLETKHACLKAAADESKRNESEQDSDQSSVEQQQKGQQPTMTEEPPAAKKLSKTAKLKLARQEKRLKRFQAVKEMQETTPAFGLASQQGFSKAEIARCTKLDPKTIRKYINAESCPRYNRGTRASKLDPYKEYIRKRFQEDGIKATQILDEIQKLGYCGGRTIMMEWVRKTLRKFVSVPPANKTPRSPRSQSSSQKVAPETVVPWTANRA